VALLAAPDRGSAEKGAPLMEIKYTAQGALIYATMLAYLLAAGLHLAKRRRAAMDVYAAGLALAAAAFVYRWWHVAHVPLKNLFEVFLCMGMLVFPLSLLCRRRLRIGGEWADMLLGAVVLFPAGFVFDAGARRLMPALQTPLFPPHVAAYLAAYVIMAKAAVHAGLRIGRGGGRVEPGLLDPERAAHRLVCMGFPLLTIGLILGAVWGKLAWGDYWNWDPKELSSLASWLAYAGYLHFRRMHGRRFPRANAAMVLAGMVLIVMTLLWVNLSRLFAGLHSYAV
jgi:ABC-type transport system involved in cytochrome c biogenesis permease subunit